MSMSAAMVMAFWFAQAEPAPAEPPPPLPPGTPAPTPEVPPARSNTLGVLARFAYRRGSEGASLGPATGFSLGASFEHRYALWEPGISLGLCADFFHDRFSMDVVAPPPASTGAEQIYGSQRVLSQTSFAVLQTLAAALGPARFWIGAGAGVTVASFSSPEVDLQPGSKTAVQPLGRGAAGIDVAIGRRTAVGLRADLTHPFTHPTLATSAGPSYSLFGELFDAGLGLLYHF
jgi:hypothetical protein